jgi:hypothetical protein
VSGKRHETEAIDGSGGLLKSKSGKIMLKIRIAAEADGVRGNCVITFRRRGKTDVGYACAGAGGQGAERYSALIKALTGKEPEVCRLKDGRIMAMCSEVHNFACYRELPKYICGLLLPNPTPPPTGASKNSSCG